MIFYTGSFINFIQNRLLVRLSFVSMVNCLFVSQALASISCDFIFPTLKNNFLVRVHPNENSETQIVESFISAGFLNFTRTSKAEINSAGYRHGLTEYFNRDGNLLATVLFHNGIAIRAQWYGSGFYEMGIRDASTRILLKPEDHTIVWGKRQGKPLRLVLFSHGQERVADVMPQSAFIPFGKHRRPKEKEYGINAFAELNLNPLTGFFEN